MSHFPIPQLAAEIEEELEEGSSPERTEASFNNLFLRPEAKPIVWPSTRPGADDALRIPSVGVPC
jgi:hypothetical protein